MPECYISPSFKGAAFPKDFLETSGTLHFVTDWHELDKEHLVFKVEGDGFLFGLKFKESCITFQRNDTISVVTTDDLDKEGRCRIIAMWSPTELTVICGWNDNRKEVRIDTVPVVPPQSLIDWARKNNLLPVISYESEELFREKVYSCLDSIQEKINESGCFNCFWNISYVGNKIISRQPKNETDVQRVVHCILSDQLLMSSIDIVPEYKTGVGNLDFMFVGSLVGKGLVKLAAEFKNLHSQDLFDGLLHQLPAYMQNKKVKYGAYCVLNYKGEWFSQPKEEILELRDKLEFSRLDSEYKNRVRIFWVDLSKPKTAGIRT